ncbi:hypothetical protein TNCV_1061111 [Trichonephila clavipes]|nr:hypothetical protein TNCV_1061111 [Trichonephila clavipes]
MFTSSGNIHHSIIEVDSSIDRDPLRTNYRSLTDCLNSNGYLKPLTLFLKETLKSVVGVYQPVLQSFSDY